MDCRLNTSFTDFGALKQYIGLKIIAHYHLIKPTSIYLDLDTTEIYLDFR